MVLGLSKLSTSGPLICPPLRGYLNLKGKGGLGGKKTGEALPTWSLILIGPIKKANQFSQEERLLNPEFRALPPHFLTQGAPTLVLWGGEKTGTLH